MSVDGRKLKAGWRYRYRKTVRGTPLNTPYVYLTRAAAAEAEAVAVARFLATGETGPTSAKSSDQNETLLELYQRRCEWLQAHRSKRYTDDTVGIFARALAVWPEMAETPVSEISEAVVEEWAEMWAEDLADRGRGPGEVNKWLRDSQSAFNEPWERRRKRPVHRDNPFQYVERFSTERRVKYVPTPAEVSAVLLAAGPEMRLYLEVIAATASRPSEARTMTWEDVGPDLVVLWTKKTRDGSKIPRKVEIPQDLVERLAAWRRIQGPGKLYVFQRPDAELPHEANWGPQAMLTLCDRLGITRFSPRQLRHFAASRWAMERVPLTTIQRRLGHESSTTTDIYLRELVGV